MDTKRMEETRFSQDDLDMARRVHRSLLPKRLVNDWIDVDIRYREMQLLGGDYASIILREGGNLLLTVCDVTGHGLAAALLAGRINSFIRHTVSELSDPCRVVNDLNAFFFRNFSDLGVFVTFFAVEINPEIREIRYAGCGHPPAILCRRDDRICHQLASRHGTIGLYPELTKGCMVEAIDYSPGDRLLLYTDGVTEARDQDGEFFGVERVEALIQECADLQDSRQVLDQLLQTLGAFRHGDARDDTLAMAVTLLDQPGDSPHP